jgi:protein ImuA
MLATVDRTHPEEIHPALWRASQLARSGGKFIDTGYACLSAELPGGGWPAGSLIELLPQRTGIGELRLLQPALTILGKQPTGLIDPPNTLNGLGLTSIGLSLDAVVHVRALKMADKLWAAEQILKAGSFGAVLLWLQQVPQASLRRLHLVAQSSETLFVVFRPEWAATQASPATVRMRLRAVEEGLAIDILKRRGPAAPEPLKIALHPASMLSRYRHVARRAPVTVVTHDAEASVEA